MQSFTTVASLNTWLTPKQNKGLIVGFVPTMGALHAGHVSLIKTAKQQCDIVVSSIFVNPTQFNSLLDLEKYPRTLENDLSVLFEANCDAVFIPEVATIYPFFPSQTQIVNVDLGHLAEVMEGTFRQGHFDGVVNVVYRLFDIVKPQRAFFGEKDFQQLAIIKHLSKALHLNVEIVACPTKRESTGLAMSSRNQRLSEKGKNDALVIYQSMLLAKSLAFVNTPDVVVKHCEEFIENSQLQLEYLKIVDPNTLGDLKESWVPKARCFVAVYCEDVRLIDNMELIP